MANERALDKIDRRILAAVQQDARMSVVALAQKVNLSKSPCLMRLRRLEKEGYIKGYIARLDHNRLEHGYVVFVQVKLERTTHDVLERFNAAAKKAPEIQSCHMVSGGFDYLLKVRTKDMESYRQILGDVIAHLPGVQQTSTFPVMEEVKDTLVIEVPGLD